MVACPGVHLSEGSLVRGLGVHLFRGSLVRSSLIRVSLVRRFIVRGFTCPYFSSTMTFLAEIEAVLMKRILYRVWGRRSPSGDPWEWRPVEVATLGSGGPSPYGEQNVRISNLIAHPGSCGPWNGGPEPESYSRRKVRTSEPRTSEPRTSEPPDK